MPAEASPARLRLAAVQDTTSPVWQSFYPEDLPADWALAYYGHFWRELLVPADDWTTWVEDPQRLDEVPAEMRVYFLVPDGAGPHCAELASRLGERLGGFLFPTPGAGTPAPLRSSQRFDRMRDPVVAGARSAQAFASGQRTVLVLEPETGLDLRQWRALLEALHAASTPGEETLIFLHAGPDELEQAQTILRLSGLAWKQN
jgi:hypothetical protein